MIGENVVTLRGEMSQKALGDAMRERGHKWSQATVWAVEKGDRPLKLTEAKDLCDVLGVNMAFLLNPPLDVSYWRVVRQLADRLWEAQSTLLEAAWAWEGRRLDLRDAIAGAKSLGYEDIESATQLAPPEQSKAIEQVEIALHRAAEEHETRLADLERRAAEAGVDPDLLM